MNKQRWLIICLIGIPVLLAGTWLFLFRSDGPATSELIDAVADQTGASCQNYVKSKRYQSVYGICQAGGLRFRVDDLSFSPEEQAGRFQGGHERQLLRRAGRPRL